VRHGSPGLAGLLAGALALAGVLGCASSSGPEIRTRRGTLVHDPLEPVNRKIFWFNDQLDRFVLEPVATGWDWVLPDPAQRGIKRFFTNLLWPQFLLNDLLQGKLEGAGLATGRFFVNSTVGVLGFWDPANDWLDWKPQDEDFGQTLGWWGSGGGPYLVLPFLGPSNPRDTLGLAVDGASSPIPWFAPWYVTVPMGGTNAINTRSLHLEDVREAKASALDYYSFVRNAYLDYRENQIHDGKEPEAAPGHEDLYYPDADAQ
jgi:phospholipid-binding lipoprotein MlaA